MKNKGLKIVGTVAVLALSTQVFAQDNQKPFYGNIDYFLGEFELRPDGINGNYVLFDGAGDVAGNFTINGTSDLEADANSVILRFGYQLHPNLSVEARYGFGGDNKGTASASIADGAMVEVTNGGVVSGGTPVAITNTSVRGEADTELDSLYGVFLRAGISAGSFYPYAIIGYTEVKVEITNAQAILSGDVAGLTGRQTLTLEYEQASDIESDVSYGIGANFRFSDSLVVNAEWISYYDKNNAKIGGFQLGLMHSF